MKRKALNPSLERTRTSRSGHGESLRQRRLIRAAHAGRWTFMSPRFSFLALRACPKSHETSFLKIIGLVLLMGMPAAVRGQFSISPPSQTAEAGSAGEFRVPAPVADWWFFNGTNNVQSGGNVLHFANVQASQSGVYTAVFLHADYTGTSPPAILNVIPRVERRMVRALALEGQPGSSLNLDFTSTLGPTLQWTNFDHVSLTQASQWYFDLSTTLTPQGFYRAWQANSQDLPSTLDLHIVPALTLTGTPGSSLRVDYINQFGPTDAWVNLSTVRLTNSSQLYFDTSSIGQPPRLWRILPAP